MRQHEELVKRLWNWAAWARIDPTAPDGSCQNPLWSEWMPRGDARDPGWGDEDQAPDDGPSVDVLDAEEVDCYVLQMSIIPRRVLCRRFVLRQQLPWDVVDPAVRGLQDLIDQHYATIRQVQRLIERRSCELSIHVV